MGGLTGYSEGAPDGLPAHPLLTGIANGDQCLYFDSRTDRLQRMQARDGVVVLQEILNLGDDLFESLCVEGRFNWKWFHDCQFNLTVVSVN